MKKADVAVIGMAVMGKNLALNIAEHGYETAVYNRTAEAAEKCEEEDKTGKIKAYYDLESLCGALKSPKVIIIMIKAGNPVDKMIEQLMPLIEKDDIIIDAGNSFFRDTITRSVWLAEYGIRYLGVGVSGGEEGARLGPAIMPGGDYGAYQHVKPMLEAIAAKAPDGNPCCHYASSDGAGHFVKMVHNGIEYADMQIISEAYTYLRDVCNMSPPEIADVFEEYAKGPLKSYLFEIAVNILREKDTDKQETKGDSNSQDSFLIDFIRDGAKQKGTGLWTNREAIDLGAETSILIAGLNARVLSEKEDERQEAGEIYQDPEFVRKAPDKDFESIKSDLANACEAAKIMAYAQGFALMRKASKRYNWDFDYAAIAGGFRNGCIIRAEILNDIMTSLKKDPDSPNLILSEVFAERLKNLVPGLNKSVISALENRLPVPAMSSALNYFYGYSSPRSGANLIQAMRDCFGAHGFERTDKEGSFHHEWSSGSEKE